VTALDQVQALYAFMEEKGLSKLEVDGIKLERAYVVMPKPPEPPAAEQDDPLEPPPRPLNLGPGLGAYEDHDLWPDGPPTFNETAEDDERGSTSMT
jgi:hypothetical protein